MYRARVYDRVAYRATRLNPFALEKSGHFIPCASHTTGISQHARARRKDSLPLNMVTGGDSTALEAPIQHSATYAQTLITNKPLLPQFRFPIQQWSPRTGYGRVSEKFKSDLSRLLKALGMGLDDLETPRRPHSQR